MEEGDFYGQEEEGFEELVEKNLQDSFGADDDQENLLSDVDDGEGRIGDEDDEELDSADEKAIKREERLKSVMAMTGTSLSKSFKDKTEEQRPLRKRIAMLCSALGGFDPNPPNAYILGMEALGCLRDMKEILMKFQDTDKLSVVLSAFHDMGLFINDLIPIMVHYGVTDTTNLDHQTMKILLTCLEIMVKLMTPLKKENEEDHKQDELFSKLRRAQIEYKYHMLHYKKGKIFKYIIALMYPIIQLGKDDVTYRDNIILNLCLTLFGQILRIQPSDARTAKKNKSNIVYVFQELPSGISEEDISIDVVFALFKKYQVLSVVQTIASNLSEEFSVRILGVSCLDFYYYTFLYVDPTTLADEPSRTLTTSQAIARTLNITDDTEESEATVSSVNNKLLLLRKEEHTKQMRFKAKSSTRHANFGSLINVQDDKYHNRVLSGQDKLMRNDFLELMDSNASKTGTGKAVTRQRTAELGKPESYVKLHYKTRQLLNKFVNDFRENGFPVIYQEIQRLLDGLINPVDFTFHFHYYFVLNWILRFERSYQSNRPKSLKSIERFKYLYCFLHNKSIRSLIASTIPNFWDKKNYDCLNITVSNLKEILQMVLSIHSYTKFDDPKLLSDDKEIIRGMIVRAEATFRCIFEIHSEIHTLLRYPQNAHKKSYSVAIEMIEFTNVLFKVLNYITRLDPPVMLLMESRQDFNEEFEYLGKKKSSRSKVMDATICKDLQDMLLNDHIVETHMWLFLQYREINETQLGLCLSYFSRLLEDWEANFLKLVRLDFMFALHELKNANISDNMRADFGNLLNFFMHKFTKLCSTNTKLLLLEPMTLGEMTDINIRKYYMSGDAFTSSHLNYKEKRHADRRGNEDIKFSEDVITQNEKISLLVSTLYYQDNISKVERLVNFYEQWFSELNGTDVAEVIGKLGAFRLEGESLKYFKINPYFRALCQIGDIENSILLTRDANKIKSFKESIQISINTPLEAEKIEGKIIDPNVVNNERKRLRLRRGDGGDGEEDDDDDDDEEFDDGLDRFDNDHHGYGSDGIDDNDDLAGSESEGPIDELDVAEARLEVNENRVKGRAFKRVGGELVELGKKSKKSRRKGKGSKKDKDGKSKSKRRHKKRKIVQDDDEILSDREVMRRAHLSKDIIEDSDEEMEEDAAFFEREVKLQQLLQKRHGKITKHQYDSLMNNTLDIDDVSDLDDQLVSGETQEIGPQIAALANPDRDYLHEILQPRKATEDSESDDTSAGDESDDESDEDNDEGRSDDNDGSGLDNDDSETNEESEGENEARADEHDFDNKIGTEEEEEGEEEEEEGDRERGQGARVEADSALPSDSTGSEAEEFSLSADSKADNSQAEEAPATANTEASEPEIDIFASLQEAHNIISKEDGT